MKILSYNVNGIRAAIKKELIDWVKTEEPDVLCLQELKANLADIPVSMFEDLGYHCFWHSAEKKGYSGVALLSKEKPQNVELGCGMSVYDCEGRVVKADFANFSQISTYFPNGGSGEARQAVKMEFLDYFYDYTKELLQTQPNLVISGDLNICHQPIDIHDPVRNKNISGFLPEEREWFTHFIEDLGLKDSFRHLNPDEVKYSWWSFFYGARKRNKGWRLDYHLVSEALLPHLKAADLLNSAVHSDHCPAAVELDF